MEEIKLIDISTPKKLKETLNQLNAKSITEEEKAYWNAKVDSAQLEGLQQELNTKASAEQLSSLAQTVGTKADQQSVDALNTTLQNKADTAYVEQLVGDIDSLLDKINGEVV